MLQFQECKYIVESINNELHTLIMAHKILHNYATSYLCNLFTAMGGVHERNTRAHPLYLLAQRVGRDAPVKSFTVRAYRFWNLHKSCGTASQPLC